MSYHFKESAYKIKAVLFSSTIFSLEVSTEPVFNNIKFISGFSTNDSPD
jgi:hypothetical protein